MMEKTNPQSLYLVIPGAPVAKGRPRFRRVGNYVQTYTTAETAEGENWIRYQFISKFPGYRDYWAGRELYKPNRQNHISAISDDDKSKDKRAGTLSVRSKKTADALRNEGTQAGISITCRFYCPIPSGLSKKKREQLEGAFCLKRPDIDNYVKLVMDALNGIAWEDDNCICNVAAVKMYSKEPRSEVYIYYLQKRLDK